MVQYDRASPPSDDVVYDYYLQIEAIDSIDDINMQISAIILEDLYYFDPRLEYSKFTNGMSDYHVQQYYSTQKF